MSDTATRERTVPRLKSRYADTLRGQLKDELGLDNVMRVPRLTKVVVNMGVGAATAQASLLEGAVRDLTTITGQRPVVRRPPPRSFELRTRTHSPCIEQSTWRRFSTTATTSMSSARAPSTSTSPPVIAAKTAQLPASM